MCLWWIIWRAHYRYSTQYIYERLYWRCVHATTLHRPRGSDRRRSVAHSSWLWRIISEKTSRSDMRRGEMGLLQRVSVVLSPCSGVHMHVIFLAVVIGEILLMHFADVVWEVNAMERKMISLRLKVLNKKLFCNVIKLILLFELIVHVRLWLLLLVCDTLSDDFCRKLTW